MRVSVRRKGLSGARGSRPCGETRLCAEKGLLRKHYDVSLQVRGVAHVLTLPDVDAMRGVRDLRVGNAMCTAHTPVSSGRVRLLNDRVALVD